MVRETIAAEIETGFRSVCEAFAFDHPSAADTSPRGDDFLAATIELEGARPLVLLVLADTASAARLASAFFGQPPDELADDDVRDALGEVANMVAGQLKSALSPESDIGLPRVTQRRGSQNRTLTGFKVGDALVFFDADVAEHDHEEQS
jgi:hypothetical protein